MKRTIQIILLMLLVLSLMLNTQLSMRYINVKGEGVERNLTNDTLPQAKPSIYGNRVVWAEDTLENGSNWEIFLYDLSSDSKIRITYNPSMQSEPDIYGDIIVWEDDRNEGYFDIYMYNLAEDTDDDGVPNYLDIDRPHPDPAEIRITDDPRHQEKPAIYNTKIVWVDKRYENRDIFIYDMISGKKAVIAGKNEEGEGKNRPSQHNPDIYGNKVVWEEGKFPESPSEICMYNLSTDSDGDGVPNYLDDDTPFPDPAETRITSAIEAEYSPSVYGDTIAYTRLDNVFLYDISTDTEYMLTDSTPEQKIDRGLCSIYGTKVVWTYKINNELFLYLYDLIIDTDGDSVPNYQDADKPSPDPALVKITNIPLTFSMFPAIYTNKIVWQDNRNVSWIRDIYLYTLTNNLPPEIIDFFPDYTPHILDYESAIFNITASDPESEDLTYTWFLNNEKLPEEKTDTFEFSDHASAGLHEVKVIVSDGEYPIEKIWLLHVIETNIASPIITELDPIFNPTVIEGEEITLNMRAKDEDSENLSVHWTWDSTLIPAPITSNITSIGGISAELIFISQLDYNGSNYYESYNITVEVTDGKHTAFHKWILTILYFADADKDGYDDSVEVALNSNPLDSTDKPLDTDSDLIVDTEDDDTDGDGFLDKYDEYPIDPDKQLDGKSDYSLEIMFIIITLILVIILIVAIPRISKT
jgi:beta propeller repeat protein